jgi:hypothetical protein
MCGLQAAETGQRRAERVTLARAIRRGDVVVAGSKLARVEGPQVRARPVVATDRWLAGERRWVS